MSISSHNESTLKSLMALAACMFVMAWRSGRLIRGHLLAMGLRRVLVTASTRAKEHTMTSLVNG